MAINHDIYVDIGGVQIDPDGSPASSTSYPDIGAVQIEPGAPAPGGLGIPIAAYHYNHNIGSRL